MEPQRLSFPGRIAEGYLIYRLPEKARIHVAELPGHVICPGAHHALHGAVVGQLDIEDGEGFIHDLSIRKPSGPVNVKFAAGSFFREMYDIPV